MEKKLVLNTITSLLLQVITIVCGFILPRYILQYYGSEVNGLVSSITRFLSLITFLEMGVGAVIQSSLYKPLADKDDRLISEIVVSGGRFFKKIAAILLCYVIVLVLGYPKVSHSSFGWIYTAMLIIAISISSFAQYYFGIIDRLLLTADQRGYIQYSSQIATLILNTIACVIIIKMGASIQLVKLISSIIFLARPLILRIYVNKNYNINRKIVVSGEPIRQKWNGIAQHIAAIILADTDTVVLTLFSTLSNVSIYYVYFMIVNGVNNVMQSLTSGVQSAFGELWATKNYKKLNSFFEITELLVHYSTTILYSTTLVLIVPFVRVYTRGINDVNYSQPLFAFLLVMAYCWYCLRIPYLLLILAGGHYKQTQKCFIIAAVLNLSISIISVYKWGLIGVAIGTLVAMIYQTIWMAIYDSRNMLQIKISAFVVRCVVDMICIGIVLLLTMRIPLISLSYKAWILLAVEILLISLVVTTVIYTVLYRRKMYQVFIAIKTKLER